MNKLIVLLSTLLISLPLFANRMVEAEYIEVIGKYHEEGIENSKLALSKTKNKEVAKIARKIIYRQTRDLKKLNKYRSKFYSDIKISENKTGIAGLDDLKKATGKNFDKLYLEQLSENHKNQIILTSKMLPEIRRGEIHHMAVKIVKNKGNDVYKIEKIKNSL